MTVNNGIFLNHVCYHALLSLAKGNTDALSVISDYFGNRIYEKAFEIVHQKEAADIVVKETMQELAKSASSYRGDINAKMWILDVARKQALFYLERRKENNSCKGDAACDDICTAKSAAENLSATEMLGLLTEDEQQVVIFKVYFGLKHREIAEVMNISVAASEKKFQRACKKLKSYLRL